MRSTANGALVWALVDADPLAIAKCEEAAAALALAFASEVELRGQTGDYPRCASGWGKRRGRPAGRWNAWPRFPPWSAAES